MKLRQFQQKSVCSAGAVTSTSMVKPLQSLHLPQFAVGQPLGDEPVRKVTEAQHSASAGVKGKTSSLTRSAQCSGQTFT